MRSVDLEITPFTAGRRQRAIGCLFRKGTVGGQIVRLWRQRARSAEMNRIVRALVPMIESTTGQSEEPRKPNTLFFRPRNATTSISRTAMASGKGFIVEYTSLVVVGDDR